MANLYEIKIEEYKAILIQFIYWVERTKGNLFCEDTQNGNIFIAEWQPIEEEDIKKLITEFAQKRASIYQETANSLNTIKKGE